MEEEESKKVESESTPAAISLPPPQDHSPADENSNSPKDIQPEPAEKSKIPLPEKESHSKLAPATDEKAVAIEKKSGEEAIDRDAVLAQLETEKRLALIKAWEESEKTKADNKACKKLSAIGAWEGVKKAFVEAQLKSLEENFLKKKAEHAEKINNKQAEIHKATEEKRALIEANRGTDVLKVEEIAAKFRARGDTPTPTRKFGCFGSCG